MTTALGIVNNGDGLVIHAYHGKTIEDHQISITAEPKGAYLVLQMADRGGLLDYNETFGVVKRGEYRKAARTMYRYARACLQHELESYREIHKTLNIRTPLQMRNSASVSELETSLRDSFCPACQKRRN